MPRTANPPPAATRNETMNQDNRRVCSLPAAILFSALLLAGCGRGGPGGMAPPAPEVGVAMVGRANCR